MEKLKQYNLLVVDDDETLRDTIVFDFKRKGFTVFSAENGTKAQEVLKDNKIDLVISDIRMPGGDGLSLLEKIRAKNATVPILIFVTGFADVTEQDCLKKGAQKVLSKPFERKQLIGFVFDALGISEKKKAA